MSIIVIIMYCLFGLVVLYEVLAYTLWFLLAVAVLLYQLFFRIRQLILFIYKHIKHERISVKPTQ